MCVAPLLSYEADRGPVPLARPEDHLIAEFGQVVSSLTIPLDLTPSLRPWQTDRGQWTNPTAALPT
jgi:hypothetical protein